MRSAYLTAAQMLKSAREFSLMGKPDEAVRTFHRVVEVLTALPPERTRDVLLGHAYLGHYQTLCVQGEKPDLELLNRGVSYARTTRDPLVRAIAQECLWAEGAFQS